MKGSSVVSVKDDGSMDRFVMRFPIELRDKMLKRALAKASRIMAKEARRGARRVKTDPFGQPPGGRPQKRGGKIYAKGKPLSRSIRSRAVKTKGDIVKHRTRTVGEANIYAVAAEYGHEKIVFGVKRGGTVAGKGFWRGAIDKTQDAMHKQIMASLRQDLKNIEDF
jgi:hypothetical protein